MPHGSRLHGWPGRLGVVLARVVVVVVVLSFGHLTLLLVLLLLLLLLMPLVLSCWCRLQRVCTVCKTCVAGASSAYPGAPAASRRGHEHQHLCNSNAEHADMQHQATHSCQLRQDGCPRTPVKRANDTV